MKRLIASRKLKRTCVVCNTKFKKGNVYYRDRKVCADWVVMAFETLMCPKCKYKARAHDIRFKEFEMFCTHPEKFCETAWSYITGECVKEPDYGFCTLCGKTLD
jgi:uncharacterized protein (DUF2225 family)